MKQTQSTKPIIVFWDEVGLPPTGALRSNASFKVILEKLRKQMDYILVCPCTTEATRGDGITIVPLGTVPTSTHILKNPLSCRQTICEAITKAITLAGPNAPILMVDAILPSFILLSCVSRSTSLYLYLRGDDAYEAKIRTIGVARGWGILHEALLKTVRNKLIARCKIIGAGELPIPKRLLANKRVFPFYPTSIDTNQLKNRKKNISPSTFTVLGIGRLVHIKRYDRLIRACSQLSRDYHKSIKLVLIGNGPQRHKLEALAKSLTTATYEVQFTGTQPKENMASWLSSASCLAISSDWEGLPKTLSEACLHGLPVVSTQVGSISQYIISHEIGIVCKRSTSALTNALLEMTNREKQRKYAANAWLQAEHFAIEKQCARLSNHLMQRMGGEE